MKKFTLKALALGTLVLTALTVGYQMTARADSANTAGIHRVADSDIGDGTSPVKKG